MRETGQMERLCHLLIFEVWGTAQIKRFIFGHVIDIIDERPGPANALFDDLFFNQMKKTRA